MIVSLSIVGGIVAVLAAALFAVPAFPAILLGAAIPWLFVLLMVAPMIWLERKGSAWIQDRMGPERAYIPGIGLRMAGMVHNIADVLKLATKEAFIPRHANRFLFLLAPIISMVVALVVGAVVPYAHALKFADGGTFAVQGLDINIGILWVLAASSVGVYALALAGWASNNKFGQLGGLRASAGMISYEITMGLAIVAALLIYNETSLAAMAAAQEGTFLWILPRWGVFMQPLAFILFFVAALAETNRAPFDLAEAESELVAGFHVEYGGIPFTLFFMGEYVVIVVQCLLMATIFLGGWQVPYASHAWLSTPGNTAAILTILLWILVVGGALIGLKLLKWHGSNRRKWKDARSREGPLLAVLFGFGPAIAAGLGLFLWSGALGHDAAAVTTAFVEFISLAVKTLLLAWVVIWVRWTVPRFRYDQLMGLGWKVLLPLGLVNVLLTAVLVQMGIL